MISKRKIDQIGELLKKQKSLSGLELSELLEWRNSFSAPLDYYANKLRAKLSDKSIIAIARRLKRIESIKIKLKRFKTMRLSTLQDVAGLRVIFDSQNALTKAYIDLRGLSTKHTLKRVDDYHNAPKEDGYRGIHLIYQTTDSNQIEIQLRTELEHIWSTAVESYGELQSTSFKTGEGDSEWKEFFTLLSSYFAIKEQCSPTKEHSKLSNLQIQSKLKKSIKGLKVIERLNAATNSIQIIVNKQNEFGRLGKYALLELDTRKNTTSVDIYNKKDVSKAIEIYTQKELSFTGDESKNIVFVNIENIEKIQESYPNYFLDTKKLLGILSKIVLNEF
ncbi:MAG: hypothetical protein KAG61_13310 [Bacteriovoracaceae bacterium]|nr:hypothetical protein [Bacteriovoracaceae bacterium]